MTLRTKMLLGAGSILFLLAISLFFILRATHSRLVSQEVEFVLKNEVLSLSTLVNARPEGLDFELSPKFMEEFLLQRPVEFFRFLTDDGKVLKESKGALNVDCSPGDRLIRDDSRRAEFRVQSMRFQPEIDDELMSPPSFPRPWICVVVGIDEMPFRDLSSRALQAAIPVFALAFVIGLVALLALTRQLTGDLARLRVALESESFNWSQPFPDLPKAHTPEVAAVIARLESLHDRASHGYRELWLFLGRAAHHLRTPVSALQTTIDVLMRKDRSKEELLAGLKDVQAGIQTATRLTQELISASRLSYASASNGETTQLEKVVDDAIRLLRPQAEARGMRIHSAGLAHKVRGDETTLLELFASLVENAILYSPDGSSVAVTAAIDGPSLIVRIEDTGPGIPAEVKRRIFEPFVRGDERKSPGSGLGLSIAKKAAQLCEGDLQLEQSSPSGTIFRARLILA